MAVTNMRQHSRGDVACPAVLTVGDKYSVWIDRGCRVETQILG